MSRFPTAAPDTATGLAAELFGKIRKSAGRVPNAYATLGTQSPAALGAILGADAALASGTLSKSDIEAIKLAVSELGGCDYCVAAHTMIGRLSGLTSEAMHLLNRVNDTTLDFPAVA
jgi:AhpD family alkylhydroperoxidase